MHVKSILFSLLVLGCAGHRTRGVGSDVSSGPILPSPDGELYTTGQSRPADELIAALVAEGSLPWDESLSGAATTLAMAPLGPDSIEDARWAAVRAGYPYPVVNLLVGEVAVDERPEGLIGMIRAELPDEGQLGMVRARHIDFDRWVVLFGRPHGVLQPFPRELVAGEDLVVESDVASHWALVSPSGELREGELPIRETLAEQGEWWLEIQRTEPEGGLMAALPLYVSVPTPADALIETPGLVVDSPAGALDEAHALLDEIRGAFQLGPLRRDRILDTLAETPLEQALAGRWSRERGEERLRGAGFVGGPVAQLSCEGKTVALCLSTLAADSASRAALLGGGFRVLGMAVQVRTDGLTLVLNLASE